MATLVSHTSIYCNNNSPTSSNVSLVAQSFTTPSGNTRALTSLTLPLGRGAIVTGTVTVGLYAVDGSGYPTGDVLSTGTVVASALVVYDGSSTVSRSTYDKVISMSAFTLQPSTVYAIQIQSSVATDIIRWLFLLGGTYSGGQASRYRNPSFPPEGWTHDFPATSDLEFIVTVTDTMSKPTDPVPANSTDPGADFSSLTFGWTEGGSGTVTFQVHIGTTGDLQYVDNVSAPTAQYITTLAALEALYDASPINQKIYWRIDATDGETTITGDEWVFDPRPAKATLVAPANEATGITLHQVLEWS